MGFFGRGKSSKRNTAAPPPGPPPPPARCTCGNFATSGKEDGLCNACRSAKAKYSAPTPVETAAAVRMQAVKRGQLSRRESTVRLLSVIADEDAQIAAAIGGVLTAANYAEVILKVHEFKRKLLAMRVIQRRARASIDARAQTPRSEQPPVVSRRPADGRTASDPRAAPLHARSCEQAGVRPHSLRAAVPRSRHHAGHQATRPEDTGTLDTDKPTQRADQSRDPGPAARDGALCARVC